MNLFCEILLGGIDKDKIRETFERELTREILQIQLAQTNQEDSLVITTMDPQLFRLSFLQTRSSYQLIQNARSLENNPLDSKEWEKKLWKLKIQERIKLLLSKLVWQIIPTRSVIRKCLDPY